MEAPTPEPPNGPGREGEASGSSLGKSFADTDGSPRFSEAIAQARNEYTEEDTEPTSISYFSLYRYCTKFDAFCVVGGVVGAVLNGACLPIFSIVFGKMLDSFGFAIIFPGAGNLREETLKWIRYYLYIGVAGFFGAMAQEYLWTRSSVSQVNRIRVKYVRSALRQEVAFYEARAGSSRLLQGVNEDCLTLQGAIGDKAARTLFNLSQAVIGLIVAFIRGWDMTLVMLAVMPFLGITAYSLATLSGRLTSQMNHAYADADALARATLGNMRTVSAFNSEDRTLAAYSSVLELPIRVGVRQGLIAGTIVGATNLVAFSCYALALWYGSTRIIAGKYTGGEVINVLFSALVGGFALGQAAPNVRYFQEGRCAGARIFSIISRQPRVDADAPGIESVDVLGRVELVDVHFSYPSRPEIPVLRGVNLVVPAGHQVALVGASGSGKSTVIALLERFYEPTAGAVMLDGRDVRTLRLTWLRRQLALVSQEPTLFASTIRENLRYARPEATDEEVVQAAVAANAHAFISALPKGYDTQVGEHGTQLSGGQKQRVAIARAILRDPKVLLLDEATSALDARSERVVQDALDRLMAGRTTITVAHRLSTVVNSDAIAVVDQGRIVQLGTHRELLEAKKGPYAVLVAMQRGRHGDVDFTGDAKGTDGPGSGAHPGRGGAVPVPPPDLPQPVDGEGSGAVGVGRSAEPVKQAEDEAEPSDPLPVSSSPSGAPPSRDPESAPSPPVGSPPRVPGRVNRTGSHQAKPDAGIVEVVPHGELGFHAEDALARARDELDEVVGAAARGTHAVAEVMGGAGGALAGAASPMRTAELMAGVVSEEGVFANGGTSKGAARRPWLRKLLGDGTAVAVADVPDDEREDLALNVSTTRLARLNKPELPALVGGLIGSAALGAMMPAFSIAFSSLISVFFLPNPHELRKESRKWSCVFVGIGVGAFVFSILQSYCFNLMGHRLARRIRILMMQALMRQEIGWFDRQVNNSGVLGSKLSTDALAVKGQFGDSMGMITQNLVTFVGGYIIAFVYGWKMTLVVTALVPVIICSVSFSTSLMVRASREENRSFAQSNAIAAESFQNIRTLAAFGMEAEASRLYAARLVEPTRQARRRGTAAGVGLGFTTFIMFAVYALAFYYASVLVTDGEKTFLECMKVFFAIVLAAFGVAQAQMFFPDVAKGKAATQRVFGVIDRVPLIDSSSRDGLVPPGTSRGEVALDGVSFCYPQRKSAPVFEDFTLLVPAGSKVALVGESGSGKSTVVQLVERFYDPDKGRVTLDGHDLRDLNIRWLREQVGLVGQEPVLFPGTIAENVRYGRPDASAEEVVAAARAANAHDFVTALPEAYETKLGPGGISLSGGQKQRIAIARAVLKDPRVLLLDEATSALDAESERLVQDALDRLMRGRTTIVVAHRLSTIRDADLIAVVYQGRIVESGTHDQLMAADGAYARLVEHQLVGEGTK